MIGDMEVLIKKLYANKEAMKKREEELARKRAEQNRATTGNFAKITSFETGHKINPRVDTLGGGATCIRVAQHFTVRNGP